MSGENDFFLSFGSNASGFGDKLKRDLAPARAEITSLIGLIEELNRKTSGSGVRQALGQQVAQGGGRGSSASSDEVEKISASALSHVEDATDELGKLIGVIAKSAKLLESSATGLQQLPKVVGDAMRGIRATINGQERQASGQGIVNDSETGRIDRGLVLPGQEQFERAVRAFAQSTTRAERTSRVPILGAANLHIPTITTESIDRGSADRIVEGFGRALQFQTRVLTAELRAGRPPRESKRGGGSDPRPPGSPSAPSRSPSAPAGDATVAARAEADSAEVVKLTRQQFQETVKGQREQLQALRQGLLAKLPELGAQGRDAGEVKIQELDSLIKDFDAQISQSNTKSGMREIRSQEARKTREGQPALSEEDFNARNRARDLISAPESPDFLGRIGRGKADFGRGQLQEIAEAFKSQGVDVPYKTKTNQNDLAQLLVQASSDYRKVYGTAGSPDLETKGRRVTAETKVDENVKRLLGDLTSTQAREVASLRDLPLAIIRADRSTGGKGPGNPTSRGAEPVPGTIQAEFRPKGRREFGAAVGPHDGQFTEEQVLAAEQSLGKLQTFSQDTLRKNAARADFNPHARELQQGIEEGKGPEAKQVARGYRIVIASLRQASDSLDALSVADRQAGARITDVTRELNEVIGRTRSGDVHVGDGDRIRELQDKQTAERVRRNELGVTDQQRELFATPEFQQGRDTRAASKQAADERREQLQGQRELSAQQVLGEANAQFLGGARQGIASKEFTRTVPGLVAQGNTIGVQNPDQFANEDIAKLRQLFNSFISSQTATLRARQEPDSLGYQGHLGYGDKGEAEQLDIFEKRFENRTGALLNHIEKLFGVAPAARPLLDRNLRDPENIAAEDRRAAKRAEVEVDRTRKFVDTPEQRTAKEAGVRDVFQGRLDAAIDARAKAEVRVAEGEGKLAEAQSDLTKREHALGEFTRLQQQIESKQTTVNRLDAIRAKTEDPANYGGLKIGSSEIPASPTAGRGSVIHLGDNDSAHTRGPIETVGSSIAQFTSAIEELKATKALAEQPGQALITRNGTLDNQRLGAPEIGKLDQDITRSERVREQLVAIGKQVGVETTLTGAIARLEREIAADTASQRTGVEASGLHPQVVKNLSDAYRDIESADRSIERLGEQISGLKDSSKKATDTSKAETTEKKASAKASQDNLRSLRSERDQVLKQFSTGKPREEKSAANSAANQADRAASDKALARIESRAVTADSKGQTEKAQKLRAQAAALTVDAQAARSHADELTAAYKKLQGLRASIKETRDASGGSGRGTGGGGTAQGGAAGRGNSSTNSILRQILARVTEIKNGGVKVSTTVRTAKTAASKTAAAKAPVDPNAPAPYETSGQYRNPTRQEIEDGLSGERDRMLRAAASQVARQKTITPVKAEQLQSSAIRQNQKIDAKQADQLIADAHAAQELEKALELLGAGSLKAVRDLQELSQQEVRTKEDALKLAAAQTSVFRTINRDFNAQGVEKSGAAQASKSILATGGVSTQSQLTAVKKSARSVDSFHILDEEMASEVPEGGLQGSRNLLTQKLFPGGSFWSKILNTTGTFIVRNFAAGFVFGITNELQQVAAQAIETERTFIRVSSALNASGKDIGNLRGDLQGISSDYGVSLNDVYETAAGLSGLFDNSKDLAGATRVVAQLQAISNGALNATEATGVLASTVSAFSAQPGEKTSLADKLLPGGKEGIQEVADVLTVVQNTLGVNVETTAEGVARMAGLARQMKISFQETAVFVAQIAKQTNQTGAAAGDQFSRIISALQTGRGRKSFTDAFGSTGAGELSRGDYGAALKTLVGGYGNLTDAQKRNLQTSLAGQRQAASFNALVNNGAKTLDALTRAENANGEAAARLDDLMNTLQGQISKLRANFQNFASALVRTHVLDFLGLFLKVANGAFGFVNKILSELNDVADNNKFIGFLRQVIGLMLGATVAVKLFSSSVHGIKASLGALTPESLKAATAARDVERASQVTAGTRTISTRPSFSTFGASQAGVSRSGRSGGLPLVGRAPLTRGLAFGLDRTVGLAVEGTGRALSARGKRLGADTAEYGNAINRGARSAGDSITRAGQGLRTRLQGLGRATNNPDALGAGRAFSRAEAGAQEAARLRQEAQAKRDLLTRQQQYSVLGSSQGSRFLRQQPVEERQLISGGVNPALGREAEELERAGTRAETVGRRFGRLSKTLESVGNSGLAADAALIGVGLLIAGYTQLSENASKAAAADLDSAQLAQRAIKTANGKGGNSNDDPAFVGPASEARLKLQKGPGANLSTAFLALKSEGLGIFNDIRGTGGGNGITTAINDQANKAFGGSVGDAPEVSLKDIKALEKLKSTGASITDVSKATGGFLKDINQRIVDVQNDPDLSDAQKNSRIAALETAKAQVQHVGDAIGNSVEGLLQIGHLTTDQFASLDALVSASQATGGRASIGSLNLKPVLRQLGDEVGAVEGTKLGRIVDRIQTGKESPTQLAVDNVKLARIKVSELNTIYTNALDANGADDPATQAAYQALIAALSQAGQATSQAIDAITSAGNLEAQQQALTGNYSASMRTYTKTLRSNAKLIADDDKKARDDFNRTQTRVSAVLQRLTGQALPKRRLPKTDAQRQATSKQVAIFQEQLQAALARSTRFIDLQISRTAQSDTVLLAQLQQHKAEIRQNFLKRINSGQGAGGISNDNARKYGNLAVSQDDLDQADQDANQAELANVQSQADRAKQDRANAEQIKEGRLGILSAYADARGDAVGAARIQRQIAESQLAAAKVDLANAKTADDTAAAQLAILTAQAAIVSANAAAQQAQTELIDSQYDVTIALADAAGHTVESAELAARRARAALAAAIKKAAGKPSAEVNSARAAVIAADAATRDAKLQDSLDTIDFNLQIGKITQSSAIRALQNILKTNDLTKAQRRSLLLQIKGMKDQLSDSQFNFGDIKLPTAYQVRRFVTQQRQNTATALQRAVSGSVGDQVGNAAGPGATTNNTSQEITFNFDGADLAKVEKVVRQVVGGGGTINVRSTAGRRT